jgi:peptidoglycan/LPS O-acetylase OafA/YrhL
MLSLLQWNPAVALVASLLAASASYRWVERQFRRRRQRHGVPRVRLSLQRAEHPV